MNLEWGTDSSDGNYSSDCTSCPNKLFEEDTLKVIELRQTLLLLYKYLRIKYDFIGFKDVFMMEISFFYWQKIL